MMTENQRPCRRYYAGPPDTLASCPIEGGAEVDAETYREMLAALTGGDGRHVVIRDGRAVLRRPPAPREGARVTWNGNGWDIVEVPKPPPEPACEVVWSERRGCWRQEPLAPPEPEPGHFVEWDDDGKCWRQVQDHDPADDEDVAGMILAKLDALEAGQAALAQRLDELETKR